MNQDTQFYARLQTSHNDVVALRRRDSRHELINAHQDPISCGMAASSACHTTQMIDSSPLDFSQRLNDTTVPDLYREDDFDAGPRPLSAAVCLDKTSMSPVDEACTDIVHVYNHALELHINNQLAEAAQTYEFVSLTVQSLLQSPVSSTMLMEVGLKAYNNYATIAYSNGDFTAALISLEASLLFAHQLAECPRPLKLERATVLSNWCHMNWKRGDFSPALYQALGEVLQLRCSLLAWDHQDIAASHYNIAVAEYATNNNASATTHLSEYLKIASHRSQAGLNDLDPIPALTYFLLIKNEEKEDETALELVRGLRALQDKRQEQGPESAEVASVLNFIGTLLFHTGELDHALIFFQEELRLEEKLVNCVNDISVSVTCNNIGRILQELGNFEEAVIYYKRALRADSETQEALDQSTTNLYSTVWYNLGLIHDKIKAYPEAIGAFQKSLELRKAMLGDDHPDIACLWYNIGVLQMERQLLADASSSFAAALRIRYHGNGNQLNDERVIKTLEKLAALYKAKGNIQGAINASRDILKILELSGEFDHEKRLRDSALLLRGISELHHASGDMPAALSTAKQSVHTFNALFTEAQKQANKADSLYKIVEQLASSLVLLGSLYHELSEPILADSVISRGFQLVDKTVQSYGPNVSFPPSLHVLREVAAMLAKGHCAPQA